MLKYIKLLSVVPLLPIVTVAATIGFAVITTCLGTYGVTVWVASEVTK